MIPTCAPERATVLDGRPSQCEPEPADSRQKQAAFPTNPSGQGFEGAHVPFRQLF
jgi:hypothetical protein